SHRTACRHGYVGTSFMRGRTMNRMMVASVAGLMVLASSAQALASMSLSSPQAVEPGCPTTGSASGTTNGKDNSDSSAGATGRASVPTTILPTAAIPSSTTSAPVPSDTTTATIPSGATTATAPSAASSAPTTGTSRATSATTGSSDRRRTEQVERWDELNQRIGEL